MTVPTGRAVLGETLLDVYHRLYRHFGPQHWWPARTPFEVTVGAILTQSVAWSNVERAIANLDGRGLIDVPALARVPADELARLIRPAGYYNVKARKLKAFVGFLMDNYGGNLAAVFQQPLGRARDELLAVYGIGPETADSILLYAGNLPSFVIDAYTRRICGRLGIGAPDEYEALRTFFMANLPREAPLYNEYHALLVALGKDRCLKSRPRCQGCPVAAVCAAGAVRGPSPVI